ncbi:MAG: HAD family hydrolase [Planctomycetaceae bacterium]
MSLKRNTSLNRPSCLLLDLDNTIYEYAPAHQAGLDAASTAAGELLNITDKDFRQALDSAREEIKRRLGKVAASHSRLLYFQRLIERLGLSSQVASALQIEQAYWGAFLSAAEIYPEVYEFLDDLRLLGIPVVIVTDLTADIQFRKVLYWKLDRYIDWIVTSEEAGADKPAAKIYEIALAKLGGVEGEIWMVGDNPETDIAGAKAAVSAVGFQMMNRGYARNDEADFHIQHFGELRQMLQNTQS